ncbi:MAG: hydrolase Nlp/P60 [Bacteroidetes bacterium 4572_77]|nr:MAG: hydrolase Nlp/P60 [Bacteroidetes bacterium 4572_77]
MKYGFCHLAIVPLRELASDRSEMKSQLLFGDIFEVLEEVAHNWIYIRNAYDNYEGFIDPKQQISIAEEEYNRLCKLQLVNDMPISIASSQGEMHLPLACSFYEKDLQIKTFSYSLPAQLISFNNNPLHNIMAVAKSFLNAPYLWGGKTLWGVDCSGFTQSVFKVMGIKLLRDASQQATQGEILSFLQEVKEGDLAFFDDEEGQINHVGILLSANEIIHASGKVRIDKIDHQGIFNEELGKYTHKLRILKRMIF